MRGRERLCTRSRLSYTGADSLPHVLMHKWKILRQILPLVAFPPAITNYSLACPGRSNTSPRQRPSCMLVNSYPVQPAGRSFPPPAKLKPLTPSCHILRTSDRDTGSKGRRMNR